MKKLFKDWTRFELGLITSGIAILLFAGIWGKSDLLTVVASITGVMCAINQARGKISSQFIGLVVVVLYSMVSYKNRYYGEVLIYVFIMLPLFISGIISWIRNVDKETDTVIENKIKKREWTILSIISVILFIGLYYLLKCFNTSQLVVSTLSMVTSLFATYLVARRSKFGFLFYIGNDIILFILWGLPVLYGNYMLLPMLVDPIVCLANDIYGWISWNKRAKK